MRRFLASLLLALFGLAPVSSLLASNLSPDLPSCCRRDGKHHCSSNGAAAPSQPGAPAATAKCPLFPQTLWGPHTPRAASLGFSQPVAAEPAAAALAIHASSRSLRLIPTCATQKRGPPQIL